MRRRNMAQTQGRSMVLLLRRRRMIVNNPPALWQTFEDECEPSVRLAIFAL